MPGEFIGEVRTRWLVGDGGDRDMVLLRSFGFKDSDGKVWTAPRGSVVNGASIPAALWTFGPPYVGDYRFASVIHDHYCVSQTETWEDTHYMFYEACRAGGVGLIKAKAMWAAVHFGGPRWPAPDKRNWFGRIMRRGAKPADTEAFESLGGSSAPKMGAEDFEALSAWIESNDPDISAIKAKGAEMASPLG